MFKRKEKGRVELQQIHSIEAALVASNSEEIGLQGELFAFQIGYQADNDYTLYLLAFKDEDRIDWILALRQACVKNKNLRNRYHFGIWNGKKWNCCRNNGRDSLGCENSTTWRNNQDSNESKDKDKDSDKENNSIKTVCLRDLSY
ncbi:hypothetical protein HHI36_010882 [Cryptolaemus montrouzieri]|uniref:PH domain-containing protein n=1 Tax=Cryptolaemus montrouzieri TaxID=559131 RepID=A0ABD2MK05_9CUCU